ncbi:D-glycero-alpha-D-manno-heptose 1-phosphate guanylyltransferase [mine drainage metagenome]|uniref:D-glycero-alpha-D-manno-heptose 1-phosphate guanylyltransferase n=1 Tax=mine drainage metagenome TaxID=410659 RepID=A0A1J5RVM0_9ZZZZ
MAPINGKPFIAFVIDHLQKQGIDKFILSLGYKSEAIIEFINNEYSMLNVEYSIEEEPLGTGGAIKLACSKATTQNVIATNGDTLFKVNLDKLSGLHQQQNAECTLSLKPMQNFERYGVVELNNNQSISSFKEKQFYKQGFINGGLYALNVQSFLQKDFPEKFSFEKDYLEKYFTEGKTFGSVQDEYFIDIGIPEDYNRAQKELL